MNLILFDDPAIRVQLLPFTFTRPVANVRVGILTIAEKWAMRLQTEPSYFTVPYLQTKFPHRAETDNLYVNGAVCPTPGLVSAIEADLRPASSLLTEIAFATVLDPKLVLSE